MIWPLAFQRSLRDSLEFGLEGFEQVDSRCLVAGSGFAE